MMKQYRYNTDLFIKKSKEVHGDKYDYSITEYKNKRTKVKIICPVHGIFEQWPKNHYNGQGCPECGKKYAQKWRKYDYQHFIEESIKRFGDVYDFPEIETLYENSHSKIKIRCKKCTNTFEKIACDHLTSPHGGCLMCYANKSKGEEEIANYIKQLIPNEEILLRTRSILNNNELDIYIPSKKIAIEYNGVYWHSNAFKDKNYHLMKLEECKSKGIKLIQIFEDEYLLTPNICLSKIKHILGVDNSLKIYARKCTINEINKDDAYVFLNKNHIQGPSRSTIYIGAFYNNVLIAVMTFLKEKDKWELNRFATDNDYRCIGIGGKLFSYFIKKYDPKEVKSFADRRWTVNEDSNLYIKMGFSKEKYLYPDYKYIKGSKDVKRYHKFNFRKERIHKRYGLPLTMSESEMIKELGYYKVYDCGLIKYIWKKDEENHN